MARRARQGRGRLRHRHRRHHDLSRLQAGALHRVVEARRRRHGDGRDRGHLQLLRREGENRHRPLSRARAGGGAGQGRGGGPCHHGGIRLADAVAGRRASPHRRQQEGGRRHLRGAAGALQSRGRRARDRRRRDGGRAVRQAADRQRHARGAHAGGLRLGRHRHVRAAMEGPCRRGDRGRRPHHRGAERAPGRPLPRHEAGRHPGARPPLDTGPLFPGRRARPGLGRHQCLRSAGDHRQDRSQAGLAWAKTSDGLDHGRAFGMVRARQGSEAAARRHARGGAPCRRPHRRELRAGALHRAVHGRRRRLAARRRHGESRCG